MDNKMRELNSVDLILEMLKNKHYAQARQAILDHNAVDIAEILEDIMDEMGVETMVVLFRTLPKDISVDVFSYLPTDDQLALINAITDKELKFILDDLAFDDMIDVLEELPANLVDKILEKTPKNERRLINTFLNYPENSAGTLMTPDYISLRSDMSVRDALLHIKREGMDSETIYTCYVKDSGRKLIGVVSLRKLVISDDELKIADIMTEDLISINVFEDQERASEVFKRYKSPHRGQWTKPIRIYENISPNVRISSVPCGFFYNYLKLHTPLPVYLLIESLTESVNLQVSLY